MARQIDKRLEKIIENAIASNGTDVVLSAGEPASARINGRLSPIGGNILNDDDILDMLKSFMSDNAFSAFCSNKEYDGAISVLSRRLRVNAFFQRDTAGCVLRILENSIPTPEDLSLPQLLINASSLSSGLIAISGPTGSGKTTTLASIVHKIQKDRAVHIITIEDPIEYEYPRGYGSIVEQRQVGEDTKSFDIALRGALRENPDVILVGELRDTETMRLALMAAETGHLVFCTVHTEDASTVPSRIAGSFSGDSQNLIRQQLANSLQLSVAQRLIPRADGNGMVAAFGILSATPAIRSYIRDARDEQIHNQVLMSKELGMIDLTYAVGEMVKRGVVTIESAILAVPKEKDLRTWLSQH